jgi:hypothetical protein
MARKRNLQKKDVPQNETIKENVVESEPISIDMGLLSPEPEEEEERKIIVTVEEDDMEEMEEDFGVDMEEEIKEVISEEFDVPEEKIEVVVEEKKPTQGLSRAQMRIFERTGIVPK